MYKVIYQKHDGKVVGCYPFEYIEKTEHFRTDSEGYETNVDETEEGAYPKTFLVESARFFYNSETCEAVDFESVPEITKNQYLVYENGSLFVKKIIQDYKTLAKKYIHEKYDYDKQIEVLREQDINPEQFNEFNDYVISCIARAKAETGNM